MSVLIDKNEMNQIKKVLIDRIKSDKIDNKELLLLFLKSTKENYNIDLLAKAFKTLLDYMEKEEKITSLIEEHIMGFKSERLTVLLQKLMKLKHMSSKVAFCNKTNLNDEVYKKITGNANDITKYISVSKIKNETLIPICLALKLNEKQARMVFSKSIYNYDQIDDFFKKLFQLDLKLDVEIINCLLRQFNIAELGSREYNLKK